MEHNNMKIGSALHRENSFTKNIITMQTNAENPVEGKDEVKQVSAADE